MEREGILLAALNVLVISIITISVIPFVIYYKRLIGPALILLGLISWILLKIASRKIKSVGADIIFGAIYTGILAIAALLGASFAGVLGAVIGGAVGDAVTDGIAGIFEGKVAQYVRKHGIKEAITPLSASMGKMNGCLLGAGIVLPQFGVFQ